MKKIMSMLLLYGSHSTFAQHSFIAKITNEDTRRPLPGVSVTIQDGNKGAASDSSGIVVIQNLPQGQYHFRFTCSGYRSRESVFIIPLKDTLQITLEPSAELLQDVVVSTTRLGQRIKNAPVNIEVIGREDIEEGTAMSPANIRELLSELSGTQLQQTSAVSGNTTIRLQGLDGRYTQLLKDGFPLYGGFSGSLSVLQTPPLDLQQVEIIKGAGSALYGGDAIAGIINLVSKTPDSIRHADAILNQTSKGGTDFSSFYSKRNRRTGITLLATTSRQQAFDVNNDGFTDLPQVRQLALAPTLFWYPNDSTTLRLGVNVATESRIGGDITAIRHGTDSTHAYIEQSHTDRDYYQLSYTSKWHNHNTFSFKNTAGYFYRSLQSPGQSFSGRQWSSFTEASYLLSHKIHQDVIGVNIVTDKFVPAGVQQALAYSHNTLGWFAQDDWKLSSDASFETGLRADFNKRAYLLPRAAIIYKLTSRFTARLGAGMAYKLPTVFNALTEEAGYNRVYPLASAVKAETSASSNLSFNYHGYMGDDITFSIDQNFYFTHLTNALVPQKDSLLSGWLYYINASQAIDSKGSETNIKCSLEEWSLLMSYTFTDARRMYEPGHPQLPLTPQHRFITTLTYEEEASGFRAGADAFFTGNQYLDDATKTPSFWTFDIMAEKTVGHFSILINVENVTDTRQSRFGPMYSGTMHNPVFNEVYAPVEGIVANAALRFRL